MLFSLIHNIQIFTLKTLTEDHGNVEDEVDATDLGPESDHEEELLLSGVTFVEPSTAKTVLIPEIVPEPEEPSDLPPESAPLSSTPPLEFTDLTPAATEDTENQFLNKPDPVVSEPRAQTKDAPEISKASGKHKNMKPRRIRPKVPMMAPGLPYPFISSKQVPILPGQVKEPSEVPLKEDVNLFNKQDPKKKKGEKRPYTLLPPDSKKELSKHFVDQLKGILNTVSPRPIYLVPRDSSKSPFLVIPEQLQSEVDESLSLTSASKDKDAACEPPVAKKTRVVEMKSGTTYEL